MFGLDQRTVRIVWTVFAFVLAVFLVYKISATIIVFTLAVFLAHLLGPIAERVEKAIPDRYMSRSLSLALVYLVMVGAILGTLIPAISQVGMQAAALAQNLPTKLAQDPLANVQLPTFLEPFRDRIATAISSWLYSLDQNLIPMVEGAAESMGGVLGGALALVLIPVLSFFFLQDSHEIYAALVDLMPGEHRDVAAEILTDLHVLLVEYIRALILLAVIVFGVFGAFLYATGMPYAALLAGFAAVFEIIPVAGPLASGVVIIFVGALTGYTHLWALIAFLVGFRLVQDYVINPHLMSAGVAIHPLWVLFGVLAGEQIAGIPGMFFSVPVIAALRVVVVRMRRKNIVPDVLVT